MATGTSSAMFGLTMIRLKTTPAGISRPRLRSSAHAAAAPKTTGESGAASTITNVGRKPSADMANTAFDHRSGPAYAWLMATRSATLNTVHRASATPNGSSVKGNMTHAAGGGSANKRYRDPGQTDSTAMRWMSMS